jgi:hypothetical protein
MIKRLLVLPLTASVSLLLAQNLSGTFQCQSLVIGVATGPASYSVGFTTPSAISSRNPQLPLNGEFEYAPGNAYQYRSYWVMYQGGTPIDLGIVGFGGNSLLADSDANGIPNFAERTLPANVVATLVAISDIDGGSDAGTITLTRNAGQVSGNSVTRFNSGAVFSGTWMLPHMDVAGTYDLGQRSFRFRTSSSYFSPGTMTGTYTIDSADSVTMANIVFQLDSGPRLVSTPVTFTRFGKTYRCIVEFVDGNPVDTNYPDFRRWTLQLIDPADSDGDGVPDFSDSTPAGPPPVVTSNPVGVVRTVGQAVTFTVAAAGSSPLSYQWRLDGTPIAGATAASYTIPSVTLADAGTYTAAVRNASGEVISEPAVLTVNPKTLPRLNVRRETNGRLTLSWTGAARLTWSSKLAGPFTPVAGAVSGYQTIPGVDAGFYRLEP